MKFLFQRATSFRFFCILWGSAALIAISLGCAAPQTPYSKAPIDFSYEMQGETYSLNQLYGTPVLLVLVRTSEVTNEMHLDEIQKAVPKIRGRAHVLVLTIASNEAPMLDMFVEFHKYPFHIGISSQMVTHGQSPLGVIPDIPTTYVLSRSGHVLEMLPGARNAEKIITVLQSHHIMP